MSSENLTPNQKKCVDFIKGTALVSASAGSGKTHVVIERIINLVANENVPVDKILAMTFTNLAASEMKEKLKNALIKQYNTTKSSRLKEELLKVNSADINTIHAFCSKLLKKYFYVLGLDANFEIADEKKSEKLKNEALNSLFELLYESKDSDFFYLLSVFRKKRKDYTLKSLILELENFSQRFLSVNDLIEITNSSFKNQIQSQTDENEVKKLNSALVIANKLLNLLIKFNEVYSSLKKENVLVDFEDLNTLTLELLKNEDVLNTVKNSYEYIFVDEYQDVNFKQEKLLNLLSKDNCFEVGDSKQSIYAFRGCNPKFFNDKFYKYKHNIKDDNSVSGTAIPLDYNFRSASNIISVVNKIFSEVFVNDFCGMNYSENPMIYGNLYGDYKGEVKYHLIDKIKMDKKPKQEDNRGIYSVIDSDGVKLDEKVNYEHLIILKLIQDTVNKKFYYDIKEKEPSKKLKKYEYKDICILVRSLSKYTEELTSLLVKNNIPVSANGKMSIGEYPEIKVLMDLLSAISLANQDIPLASIMLNLYDFSENELAQIRNNQNKYISFFACVKNASLQNTELGVKIKNFLNDFENVRILSEYAPANEVLNKIISDTKWDIRLLSSPNGEAKLKRVEKFIYESCSQNKELKIKEFNNYVNKFIDKINVSEASGENTVRIMTAHSSKGLEFPFVILTGVNKRYNTEDTSGNLLFSEKYGVAPKSFDFENMLVSENSLRNLIKEEYKLDHSVEEARLLYVEFTRAKCELHVVIGENDLQVNRDDKRFYDAKKPADFLSLEDCDIVKHTHGELQSVLNFKENQTQIIGKTVNSLLSDEIRKNLNYVYPYANEIYLPIKSSVSQNNHTDEYFETTKLYGESDSETGTAYHRFLQLSSLNAQSVEIELESFLKDNLMSKRQISLLNTDKLKNILNMDIFKTFKDYKVLKEQKFCQLVDSSFLGFENTSSKILIQGIIDCVLIKEDSAILIDYKLSTIKNEEDIKKAYFNQMKLYKHAIENLLNLKVEKVKLINILQEKVIELSV